MFRQFTIEHLADALNPEQLQIGVESWRDQVTVLFAALQKLLASVYGRMHTVVYTSPAVEVLVQQQGLKGHLGTVGN